MGEPTTIPLQKKLVFDIGAHLGNRTEFFLQHGNRVVSVEPLRHRFEALIRKFGDNPNFQAINVGLAAKTGKLRFWQHDLDYLSTFSERWKTQGRFGIGTPFEKGWHPAFEVEVLTLDVLIERFGKPDFCKIDVEGSELYVLQGLSQFIGTLCFEFNLESLDLTQQCLNHLSKLGYKEYQIVYGDHLLPPPDADWHEISKPVIDICSQQTGVWGDIYCR